jgi:hypothetical protein
MQNSSLALAANIRDPTTYLPKTAPITGYLHSQATELSTAVSKPSPQILPEGLTTIDDSINTIKANVDALPDAHIAINNHEMNQFTTDGYLKPQSSTGYTRLEDARIITEQQNAIFTLGAIATITLLGLIGSVYVRR